MEWDPTTKLEVAKVAVPPLRGAVPSVAAPSKKVTVPVAAAGATLAEKVTSIPPLDGLRLEDKAVVVLVLGAEFTVCETAGDVLVL